MITYENIREYHNGKLTVVAPCGVPELDKHIRFKRNFTVIGGSGNVGKTTGWMAIMFIWAIKFDFNLKFLMFLNENDEDEMAMQMIEWYSGKWITDQSKAEVMLAIEWVNEHFMFLPNDYSKSLVELLRHFGNIKRGSENQQQFDFDGVFLDPYNSIPVPKGYIEHYENASHFRGFIKKYNVKFMVSMHPNSEAQRKRDEGGVSAVPHLTSLEHGSMWYNRSDDSVIIHRQTQIEELKYITELHVQKIKHVRSGGCPTAHNSPILMTWTERLAGRFMFENSGDVVPKKQTPTAKEIEFKD